MPMTQQEAVVTNRFFRGSDSGKNVINGVVQHKNKLCRETVAFPLLEVLKAWLYITMADSESAVVLALSRKVL